ncbi:hypothetical protein AM571_CH03684 [Rhizobium etli 8C-3]|uniref:Uncharacterized protein n=1 Tax=Rhizobium etli 8C-3 TaxID=538025 RepID=A0A1L5P8K1_RHIET|nr:hypothetical protein AM571_CH03684 [Rhizobium etli 8C-3]
MNPEAEWIKDVPKLRVLDDDLSQAVKESQKAVKQNRNDDNETENHFRKDIRRDQLEAGVLNALRHHLMEPELFKKFCDEFTSEMNRLRMEGRTSIDAAEAETNRSPIDSAVPHQNFHTHRIPRLRHVASDVAKDVSYAITPTSGRR